MNALIIIGIITYIIGVIIVFKLHINELGMLLINPILLIMVVIVSLGSWISLLLMKTLDE